MKTIITPFEVKASSTAGRNYPLDNIRVLLPITERDFIYSTLGSDFYDDLLKNRRDFKTAQLWDKTKTYTGGDLVIYEFCVFESKDINNTSEPSTINEKWVIADKFTKKAYNLLYDMFLKNILAFKVYKEALPLDTIKSDAKGLTITGQDQAGTQTALSKDIDFVQRNIQSQIDRLVEHMICWIKEQHELWKADNTKGLDFSKAKIIKTEEEVTELGTGGRRIGFLH